MKRLVRIGIVEWRTVRRLGREVEMRPEIFRRGRHLGKSPHIAQGHRITADRRTGNDVERARPDARSLLSLRMIGRPTEREAGRQQSSEGEKPGRGIAFEHGNRAPWLLRIGLSLAFYRLPSCHRPSEGAQ